MVPQPRPIASPSSRAEADGKLLWAELHLVWRHRHLLHDKPRLSPRCTSDVRAGIRPRYQLTEWEKGREGLQAKGQLIGQLLDFVIP